MFKIMNLPEQLRSVSMHGVMEMIEKSDRPFVIQLKIEPVAACKNWLGYIPGELDFEVLLMGPIWRADRGDEGHGKFENIRLLGRFVDDGTMFWFSEMRMRKAGILNERQWEIVFNPQKDAEFKGFVYRLPEPLP